MTKSVFIFSLIISGLQVAQAKDLNCNFTEPFISITLPVGKELLSNNPTGTVNDAARDGIVTVKVKAAIESKTKLMYLIEMPDSGSLQKVSVDLTKEGSDGMSDETYPAEGKLALEGYDQELTGGCEVK